MGHGLVLVVDTLRVIVGIHERIRRMDTSDCAGGGEQAVSQEATQERSQVSKECSDTGRKVERWLP